MLGLLFCLTIMIGRSQVAGCLIFGSCFCWNMTGGFIVRSSGSSGAEDPIHTAIVSWMGFIHENRHVPAWQILWWRSELEESSYWFQSPWRWYRLSNYWEIGHSTINCGVSHVRHDDSYQPVSVKCAWSLLRAYSCYVIPSSCLCIGELKTLLDYCPASFAVPGSPLLIQTASLMQTNTIRNNSSPKRYQNPSSKEMLRT